jgi:hypothetical protein
MNNNIDDCPIFPVHRYDGWGRRYITDSDGPAQYMLCSQLNLDREQVLRQESLRTLQKNKSTVDRSDKLALTPFMISYLAEFAISKNLCWPKRPQKSERGWFSDIPADREVVTSQKLEYGWVKYMLENVLSVNKEVGDEDEVVEMREAYDMIRKMMLS